MSFVDFMCFEVFFFLMLYENNFNPEPRGSEEDEAMKSSK